MSSMFWGLRLEPGKRYSTTVDKSFHVSMAALDCSSIKSDNEVLSVMIDEGESNTPFILCNLQKNKLLQSPLDLNFMSGDRITIFCKGNGVVHLSGYIVPDDDELGQLEDDDDEDGEDEDEEEEDEANDKEMQVTKGKKKVNGLQGKRKMDELKNPQTKKKKLETLDEDSDDSDDEDDDIASDENEDEIMGLEGEESDDDDDDEDDEEEDDDDDDDDDDDEEEEEEDDSAEEEEESDEENMPSKTLQQTKKNKKNKGLAQQLIAATNKHMQQTSKEQNQQNSPTKQNQGKQQKTVNGLTPNAQTKKDKKKGDKAPGGTPTTKLNKSNDESSPSGKKGGEGVSPARKILDGGVMVKDIKMGNGPLCKSGKMACVYYTGRLKQNNKVFDSTTEGSGFKFRVGKGEVIKGWDVGVVGMKVGGKRLITCPPHMAYGQKGSPPTIPANSTLVFEVELKNIN